MYTINWHKFICFILFIVIIFLLLIFIIIKTQSSSQRPHQWPVPRVLAATTNPPSEVIVSLSTIPSRINLIRPTLESLISQSFSSFLIFVVVPYFSKRENTIYSIPPWLSDLSKSSKLSELSEGPTIKIIRSDDYGPASKLLGTLKYLKENNYKKETMIITVDDDRVYHPDLVKKLVSAAQLSPNDAFGLCGVDINGTSYRCKTERKFFTSTNVLAGHCGVIYRLKFFDDEIFEYIKSCPREVFLSDDLMISSFLGKYHARCLLLPTNISHQIIHEIDDKNPLWKIDRDGTYASDISYLSQYHETHGRSAWPSILVYSSSSLPPQPLLDKLRTDHVIRIDDFDTPFSTGVGGR